MNFLQNQNPPVSRFSDFSSNRYLPGTREFLNSNSFIAKIAFLFLVIVLFILALRIGFFVLSKIFSFKSNPILLDGMIDSKEMFVIPQNPSTPGAIPVQRSANQDEGIEFTWSTWIFINDLSYKQGQYRHIFHKGNDGINLTTDPKGMNYPNNAPGLYIGPSSNELVAVFNTFNNITEQINIPNFPVKKWVNIILRCNGNVVDVFINGTLTRRQKLSSVIKQNYGDVFVSMNGGFDGYTSSLRYFSSSLNTSEISSLVNKGPNVTPLGSIDMAKVKNTTYLSQRWYNDMF